MTTEPMVAIQVDDLTKTFGNTTAVDGLRAVLVGTSAFPVAVDLGALLVSSAITVAVGTYLFECIEGV